MTTIRVSKAEDVPVLLDLWRRSVLATHHYLAADDFATIEKIVRERYLPNTPLLLAVDAADTPVAFLGILGGHIVSLFVDPDQRGQGIGKMLVLRLAGVVERVTVDVNEQNEQAVGFYLKLGFRQTGRSETDHMGWPYPLLHMERLS